MSRYWNRVSWKDISINHQGPYESGLLKLNCDKALFYMNWHSVMDFKETVRFTAEWYRNYYNNSENKCNSWYNCDLTNPKEYDNLLRLVIQTFYTNISENRPNINSISFAFEENNFSKQALYHSKMIAADTTHLVVIGYSFPDFNREIDRHILNKMEKLEYICIQNKEANKLLNKIAEISENIKNKISKMNFKTYLEEYLDEFHLPFHL
jgi:hypothetical protein